LNDSNLEFEFFFCYGGINDFRRDSTRIEKRNILMLGFESEIERRYDYGGINDFRRDSTRIEKRNIIRWNELFQV